MQEKKLVDGAVVNLTQDEIDQNLMAERDTQRIVREISGATQSRLDLFAQTRNYDNVNSIGKYINLTDVEIATLPATEQPIVERYRAECRYLALMVSATWAKLESIYATVQAGARTTPTGYADIEAELPELVWPV